MSPEEKKVIDNLTQVAEKAKKALEEAKKEANEAGVELSADVTATFEKMKHAAQAALDAARKELDDKN